MLYISDISANDEVYSIMVLYHDIINDKDIPFRDNVEKKGQYEYISKR